MKDTETLQKHPLLLKLAHLSWALS